jgi:asparagine synthase (glutamine-hydrolysing)
MRDTLLHRGPDGAGLELFEDGRAGLAHRRLAILDISPDAHQPMATPDGRFWLAFNGEIYNFRELREDLARRGHVFRSSGDAAVLLAAFAEWGEACVERLRGMWALAVWDARERTLFCSRDRFGIKPFYYHDDGDLFVFASELRAILASGRVRAEPRPAAVHEFLAPLAACAALEETSFEGIQRLPAAHSLSLASGGTRRWRYWQLPDGEARVREPARELANRLDAAVRSHLVSDVPLGISLSGGLDSASILVCAARALGPGVRCYGASYPVRRWDEHPLASAVAERCKAELVRVEPDPDALFELLPRIVWHLEEPPPYHSTYTRWWVDERAARDVTVLLSGQGADELLAGYTGYDPALQWEHLAHGRLLRFARSLRASAEREDARRALRAFWRARAGEKRPGLALGERLREVAPLSPGLPGIRLRGARHAVAARLRFDIGPGGGLQSRLAYDDRLSMAHSLECRVPFLDHEFAEFAFSLPSEVKVRDGWSKHVLRRAMGEALPKAVAWRRRKRVFGMPWNEWLDARFLRETRARVLDGPALRDGWLDRAGVEAVLARGARDREEGERALWRWLCLTVWLEVAPGLADRALAAPLARRAAAPGPMLPPGA